MNCSRLLIGCAVCVGALAGCASAPVAPLPLVSRVDRALAAARPQAARYAPAELLVAQVHLSRAKAAREAGHAARARQLAEDAQADLRLAQAKVRTAEALAALERKKTTIGGVRHEIGRSRALDDSAAAGCASAAPAHYGLTDARAAYCAAAGYPGIGRLAPRALEQARAALDRAESLSARGAEADAIGQQAYLAVQRSRLAQQRAELRALQFELAEAAR